LYGNPEKIVYKNFWENLVFIGMDEFHKKYITFLTYALEVVDECIISIEDVKWVEEYTSWGETVLSPSVTVLVNDECARNSLTNDVNTDIYRNKLVNHIDRLNKSYFPEKKIYVTKRNQQVIVKR